MIEGGCRCGAVRWRLDAERLPLTYACHCLDCQTWCGSAFSQQAIVAQDRFSCTGPVGRFDLPSADGSLVIELQVEDIQSDYARLKDSVALVHELKTMPWGNTTFQVRDPEGNAVSLYMPASEAAKRRFASRPA